MPPKKIPKLSQNLSQRKSQVERDQSSNDEDEEDNHASETISDQMLEQKINDIIRFMLNCQHKKLPVKRADIAKEVMQNYKANIPGCFTEACRRLEEIFGFKIVEMKSKRHYLIVNSLESNIRPQANIDEDGDGEEEEAAKYSLLTALLTYLFMRNPEYPSASEKDVLKFLRKLDVDLTDKNHSTFGDVKNLLTRVFVQRQYVQIRKVENAADGSTDLEWSWGERAELEFSKQQCLEFYCNIYNNVQTPEDWATHFAEAMKGQQINHEENGV